MKQLIEVNEYQEYDLQRISLNSGKFVFYDKNSQQKVLMVNVGAESLTITSYTKKRINLYTSIDAKKLEINGDNDFYIADPITAGLIKINVNQLVIADNAELSAKSGIITANEINQLDQNVSVTIENLIFITDSIYAEGAWSVTNSHIFCENNLVLSETSSLDIIKSTIKVNSLSVNNQHLHSIQSRFEVDELIFNSYINIDNSEFKSQQMFINAGGHLQNRTHIIAAKNFSAKHIRVSSSTQIQCQQATLERSKLVKSSLSCQNLIAGHLEFITTKLTADSGIFSESMYCYAGSHLVIKNISLAAETLLQSSSLDADKLTIKETAHCTIKGGANCVIKIDSDIHGELFVEQSSIESNVYNVFGQLKASEKSAVSAYRLDVFGSCHLQSENIFTETLIEEKGTLTVTNTCLVNRERLQQQGVFILDGQLQTPQLDFLADSQTQIATANIKTTQTVVHSHAYMIFDNLQLQSKQLSIKEDAKFIGSEAIIDTDSLCLEKKALMNINRPTITGDDFSLEGDFCASGKAVLGFDRAIYGFNGLIDAKKIEVYVPLFAFSGFLKADSLTGVILANFNLGVSQVWSVTNKSLLTLNNVTLPNLSQDKKELFSWQHFKSSLLILTKYLPPKARAIISLGDSLFNSLQLAKQGLDELNRRYQRADKKQGFARACKQVSSDLLNEAEEARTWQVLKGLGTAHRVYETASQTVNATINVKKIYAKKPDDDTAKETKPISPAAATSWQEKFKKVYKHRDTLLRMVNEFTPNQTYHAVFAANIGPSLSGKVTRTHSALVNVSKDLAVSQSVTTGQYLNYGDTHSVFSQVRANKLSNQVNYQTLVADFEVEQLEQSGTMGVGSDLAQSKVTVSGQMVNKKGATVYSNNSHWQIDTFIDVGDVLVDGQNVLDAKTYQHAGRINNALGASSTTLKIITDKPYLYGSAGVDNFSVTLRECSPVYAQQFYQGLNNAANYQGESSTRLNLLNTDFIFYQPTTRKSGVFLSAPHIIFKRGFESDVNLGFTSTQGDLIITDTMIAPELYLHSVQGNIYDGGYAVMANHYLDLRAPNGSVSGSCLESSVQGRFDSMKDYHPAIFSGGDGQGHDGLGIYLQAKDLSLSGSYLLSVANGLVSVSNDVSLDALTDTYISDYSSKHYGGKSLFQKMISMNGELLGLSSGFYKEHIETTTNVQACQVSSLLGRFQFDVGGDFISTATLFDSNLGTQVSADGDIKLYDIQTKDKVREYKTGYWGLNKSKRRQVIEASQPNVFRSDENGNITLISKNDIDSFGTIFMGPQADLYLEAGNDLNLYRAINRVSCYENSRYIGFSTPIYDSYQAYRQGGWCAALASTSPLLAKGRTLAKSDSLLDWVTNGWNFGLGAFNRATAMADAYNNDQLGENLVGNFADLTVSYNFHRQKSSQQVLGTGSFDNRHVTFKARHRITSANAFSGHAHGDMTIVSPEFVIQGAKLESLVTDKSEQVSVTYNPVTNTVTPGGALTRNRTQSTQVSNADYQVDGNLTTKADSMTLENANITAGSMDGTQIKKTTIITDVSKIHRKGFGISVSASFSENSNSMSGSPSVKNMTIESIERQSGIHVTGDLKNASFGDTKLVGGAITADGHNEAAFKSIHGENVTANSRGFALGTTITKGSSDKIPTVPVNAAVKDTQQTAKATIFGQQGTNFTVDGEVTGQLNTTSMQGVKDAKGIDIEVNIDVPTIGPGKFKQAISEGASSIGQAFHSATATPDDVSNTFSDNNQSVNDETGLDEQRSNLESDNSADVLLTSSDEMEPDQQTTNVENDLLEEALQPEAEPITTIEQFMDGLESLAERVDELSTEIDHRQRLAKCPKSDELELSPRDKISYEKTLSLAEKELMLRGRISDYYLFALESYIADGQINDSAMSEHQQLTDSSEPLSLTDKLKELAEHYKQSSTPEDKMRYINLKLLSNNIAKGEIAESDGERLAGYVMQNDYDSDMYDNLRLAAYMQQQSRKTDSTFWDHVAEGGQRSWLGSVIRLCLDEESRTIIDSTREVYQQRYDEFSLTNKVTCGVSSLLPDLAFYYLGGKLGSKLVQSAESLWLQNSVTGALTFATPALIKSPLERLYDYQLHTGVSDRSFAGYCQYAAADIGLDVAKSAATGALFFNASSWCSRGLNQVLTPGPQLLLKPGIDAALLTSIDAGLNGSLPTWSSFQESAALFYFLHGATYTGVKVYNARNYMRLFDIKHNYIPTLEYLPPYLNKVQMGQWWNFKEPKGISRPSGGFISGDWRSYDTFGLYKRNYDRSCDPKYQKYERINRLKRSTSARVDYIEPDTFYRAEMKRHQLATGLMLDGHYDYESLVCRFPCDSVLSAFHDVFDNPTFANKLVFQALRKFAGVASGRGLLDITLYLSPKRLEGALGRYESLPHPSKPKGRVSLALPRYSDVNKRAGVILHELFTAYDDFARQHTNATWRTAHDVSFNIEFNIGCVDLDLMRNEYHYKNNRMHASEHYVYSMMQYARDLNMPEELFPHLLTCYADYPSVTEQLFPKSCRRLALQLSLVDSVLEGLRAPTATVCQPSKPMQQANTHRSNIVNEYMGQGFNGTEKTRGYSAGFFAPYRPKLQPQPQVEVTPPIASIEFKK